MNTIQLPSTLVTIKDLLDYFNKCVNSKWYTDILIKYASYDSVKTVTELGVFQGISTSAFMTTNINKLYSFDIALENININLYKKLNPGIDWTIDIKNSIKDIIPNTDLLFIDTKHKYNHVFQELNLHHICVEKFIIIHDTNYPLKSKNKVQNAVQDFVTRYPIWNTILHYEEYTGIMVLEKQV